MADQPSPSADTSKASKPNYGTEFIRDLKPAQVHPTIANRKAKYGDKYVSHTIVPESDGEFTVFFIYSL